MSNYLAWYRKYRPQSFAEVIGQGHVVSVLEEAVKLGQPNHAYLFIGSRGTGKTSLARILARSLGVSDKDLMEIDAASNTGVDDVRELQEAVYSLPFDSPYKVYIIDEAHMLSKAAFNALLKTLEEPPSHVIFVLATTEREKMLDTVVSRCETHIFRRPGTNEIKQAITKVAEKEKVKLPPGAADLIAELADGSFRDALGLLQKVAADSKVTLAEIEQLTGAPSPSLVADLGQALLEGDSAKALDLIDKSRKSEVNMRILTKLLTQAIRQATLESLGRKTTDESWLSPELSARLSAHSNKARLPAILKLLVRAWDNSSWVFDPGLPLELVVIDINEELQKQSN